MNYAMAPLPEVSAYELSVGSGSDGGTACGRSPKTPPTPRPLRPDLHILCLLLDDSSDLHPNDDPKPPRSPVMVAKLPDQGNNVVSSPDKTLLEP